MKLSILDQSPRSSGQTAQEALYDSVKLAQLGEELGYERYWIAEHHDFAGLTCSAPEIMLAYIGAHTKRIRIGAGAILLPHYKPYKVAETFHMLATLFPGRIDLGIGRAPGGPPEATIALAGNYLEAVRHFPETFQELIRFLQNDFPNDHMYNKIAAAPLPAISPELWLLGTSEKSARLAAETGAAYAFAHFMSEQDGPRMVHTYREQFQANEHREQPKTIAAVSVICAETTEQAQEIALSGAAWRKQLQSGEGIPSIEEAKRYMGGADEQVSGIIGNPKQVKEQLLDIQQQYGADEMMIVTITHRAEDKLTSYRLLAEELIQ